VFETKSETAQLVSKTIWIFSDMVNETKEFPMPAFLDLGPQRMLERVKSQRLVVLLKSYRVHIYGASTNNLTPQAWMTVKQFWSEYFLATSAELISYSGLCDVER
jgi:hypothetical protein